MKYIRTNNGRIVAYNRFEERRYYLSEKGSRLNPYFKEEDLKNHNWDKYDYNSSEWKFIQIINGFLEQRKLVEHGTTCRCSWLTKKGEELLDALKLAKENNFDFCENNDWAYEEKEEK